MKHRQLKMSIFLVFLSVAVALSAPCQAQEEHREYLIRGTVVDTDGQPIEGADIKVRNLRNYRRYSTKSDEDGEFKLFGLPHGTFQVKVSREGYQERELQWAYEESQAEMRRVTTDPVVLLSSEQAQTIETNKQLKGRLEQATNKLKANDVDGALAEALLMLEAGPDDPNALFISGLCYFEKQQYEKAIPALAKTAELQPDFADAHERLGIAYQKTGDFEHAQQSYDRLLELEPDNMNALYNTGASLYNAQQYAEALPYLDRALAIQPEDINILEMAGYAQLQVGNYPKALEDLQKAHDLTSDEAQKEYLGAVLEGLRTTVATTTEEGE